MFPYIITKSQEENPKHYALNTAEHVLNAWKSFMILWYKACNNSNPDSFFDAVKAAKWFEYNMRRLSFWQLIRFIIMIRKEQESKYRDQ